MTGAASLELETRPCGWRAKVNLLVPADGATVWGPFLGRAQRVKASVEEAWSPHVIPPTNLAPEYLM